VEQLLGGERPVEIARGANRGGWVTTFKLRPPDARGASTYQSFGHGFSMRPSGNFIQFIEREK